MSKEDIHAKIVAGEYVPRFDYLANVTAEALQERELRYHSTGGPCAWRPDPRRFTLPCGYPARKVPSGLGCATYIDGFMFWGTIDAVDALVREWLELKPWMKQILKSLDT